MANDAVLVVVGGALVIIGDVVKGWVQHRSDSQSRRDARAERLSDRRAADLVTLHEAASVFVQGAARVADGNREGRAPDPDPTPDMWASKLEALGIAGRLGDAELDQRLDRFLDANADYAVDPSKVVPAGQAYRELNVRIGELTRVEAPAHSA